LDGFKLRLLIQHLALDLALLSQRFVKRQRQRPSLSARSQAMTGV
jgi:hypothetical protein